MLPCYSATDCRNTYAQVETPPSVSYSTPRAEDDSCSTFERMEEISEQVEGLAMSQSLESNSSPQSGSRDGSLFFPRIESSEQTVSFPDDTLSYSSHPPFRDSSFPSSSICDAQEKAKQVLDALSRTVQRTKIRTFFDENDMVSRHVTTAFLESVEIHAQVIQEGGNNILAYQKLSQIAETKRVANYMDLYVALCSFVVMGYQKFFGPTERGTLMAFEILADALNCTGNGREASAVYRKATQGYEKLLAVSCEEVCKASGPHTHQPLSAPWGLYDFNSLSKRDVHSGVHQRRFHDPQKSATTEPEVHLGQCSLVNYLAIELKNGKTPGYNPVADLIGYIRKLNRKSRTQNRLFEKSELMQDWRQRSKHRGVKQRSFELFELAQEAMSLAMLYLRYKSVVGMLFSPVLALFKAPELLDIGWEWRSWEIHFFGYYAAWLDNYSQRGKHLIAAIEKLIQRYGIEELSSQLGQYLSRSLFRCREELEKEWELEVKLAKPDSGSKGTIVDPLWEKSHLMIEERELNKRTMKKDSPTHDMIMKISDLEAFVAANVSADMACILCFGNCVCQSAQLAMSAEYY
jgi:hypothetical protein